MHVCTEQELTKFNPPSRGSKKEFDALKNDKTLMCMDENDYNGNLINKRLFGSTGNSFRSVEIALIPCVPKQITRWNKHLINSECLADLNSPKSL